jgi:hypothetical protein
MKHAKKFGDYRLNKRRRDRLWIILTRDIGLPIDTANKLCNLKVADYRRVEDVINGMVDSLLAADPGFFEAGSDDYKLIRKTIRKVFKIGAFNRPILVDMWKEWTNWFKHSTAGTKLIGADRPPLAGGNVFRNLNKLSTIQSILEAPLGTLRDWELAVIGHMTSTRQMPYMGKAVEEKSLKEFEEVITSEFDSWKECKHDIMLATIEVAWECRRARDSRVHGPIPSGTAHFSVNGAGELNSPCSKGGQVGAVSASMRYHLTRVAPRTYDEETPFGVVHHLEGEELWRYLFREGYKFDYEFLKDKEFLGEWNGGRIPITVEGYYYGLDGVLGQQLLYVAWKISTSEISRGIPPRIRCSTVAELGNKARIVTVSEWWLNTLQSPVSHWLKELLRFHPSCFSTFCRQDQAWSFQDWVNSRPPLVGGQRRYPCLSSDLKNATNAIPTELMKFIWETFIDTFFYHEISEGNALPVRDQKYLTHVLDLIGPREVEFPDGSVVLATRGIPMGEALAKPSLTLWTLVAEKLGYLWWRRKVSRDLIGPDGPKWPTAYIEDRAGWERSHPIGCMDPEVRVVESIQAYINPAKIWHGSHHGGDDHTAFGPMDYLDLITVGFQSMGAMLSPAKHGYSYWFVQYCERVINVTSTNRVRVIDTLKIRLLETGQSTGLARDEKNVAIGKAAQLRRYLQWAEPRDGWSYTKKAVLQRLFISRMGAFMPKFGSPEYYGVFLPPDLGGYGLGLTEQQEWALAHLPTQTRVVNMLLEGADFSKSYPVIRRLRKVVSNTATRGVKAVKKLEDEIVESISLYPDMFNAKTWQHYREDEEFFEEGKPPPPRVLIAKLEQRGILSQVEYAKRATRGSLFRILLMDPTETSQFNTKPYAQSLKKGLADIESAVADYSCEPTWPIGQLKLERLLGLIQPNFFIDSTEIITFNMSRRVKTPEEWGGGYMPADWADLIEVDGPRLLPARESGRPDLVVTLEFAGLSNVDSSS